jgi:hypothetical protein
VREQKDARPRVDALTAPTSNTTRNSSCVCQEYNLISRISLVPLARDRQGLASYVLAPNVTDAAHEPNADP